MIHEIQAKSILRWCKRPDSWFGTVAGMNLYRGCTHNCAYCDGRAEKYRVEGVFGEDVYVKVNAIEILSRELDPKGKRKIRPKGFIGLVGGVGDAYQPIERKYLLTRRALELCLKFNYPVHILTKSSLVERDLDLLQKINDKTRALVSFSFASTNDQICKIFEPGASLPSERLKTIRKLADFGIPCGVYIMPAIPFITDTEAEIMKTLQDIKKSGARFAMFSGMTLKAGKQADYFYEILRRYDETLIPKYQELYARSGEWGNPDSGYYREIEGRYRRVNKIVQLPDRMPVSLVANL